MSRTTALTVVAAILWAASMFVLDEHYSAHGGQVTDLKPKQALLVDMYVRTRKCMRSAGTAAHERGGDAAHVQYFMLSVCGSAMTSFLSRDMTEERSQAFLLRIARTSYYEDVLRTQEPDINSK